MADGAVLATVTLDDLELSDASGVYIATFTPEQCRRIVRASIGAEVNFRALKDDRRFAMYVEQMKRGQWNWRDADPLRLHTSDTGEIVATDGQHRLAAAASARRRLTSLVLYGPEWRAGLHTDRNRTRNAAQYLAHEHGIRGAAPHVAIARYRLARDRAYRNRTTAMYEAQAINDEEIIAYVVDHLQSLLWAMARAATGGQRGFHTTAYGTFLVEAQAASQELATQFHDDMKDSALEPIDPLAQLRRVVNARYAQTGKRASREYTMANLVKAWNMRAARETVTKWLNANTDEVFYPAGFVPSVPTPTQGETQ